MAGQHHTRGRVVSDGFRIFDHPDDVIFVRHKDGSLGFPFRVPSTEAPPRQHFCTQSARPGFVCWAPQLSSLIQPAREAFFCCAESDLSAARPQTSNKTRTIQRLVIFSSSPVSSTRLHACFTQIRRGLRPATRRKLGARAPGESDVHPHGMTTARGLRGRFGLIPNCLEPQSQRPSRSGINASPERLSE